MPRGQELNGADWPLDAMQIKNAVWSPGKWFMSLEYMINLQPKPSQASAITMCHIPEESKTKVAKVLAKQHSLKTTVLSRKRKDLAGSLTSGYFLKTTPNGLGSVCLEASM